MPIPGHVLAERLANITHHYTLDGRVRPFGCNALVATYDSKNKHALYLVETSGNYNRFFATAVGKHRQNAKTEFEKMKLSETTCQEALAAVAKVFISQRDDSAKKQEIEMAWLTEGNSWVFEHVPQQLVQEAEAAASAALNDSEMDDD